MINTKARLVKFLEDKSGVQIKSSISLFEDLDLNGLDANLFLDDFSTEFNVDMNNFKFKDYFGEVPFFPFQSQIEKLIGIQRSYKKITLDDLVSIIEKGVWPAQ